MQPSNAMLIVYCAKIVLIELVNSLLCNPHMPAYHHHLVFTKMCITSIHKMQQYQAVLIYVNIHYLQLNNVLNSKILF